MKVIGRCLRRHGIRTLLFIDDALCALPSKADALRARDFIEQMFVRSGLTRASDKGVWTPTRHLPDHLGFDIDTSGLTGQLKVPERRCRDVRTLAKDLLCRAARNSRKVSTDMLRSFTGKVSSFVAACSQARFRSRSLFDVCEEWNPTSTLDRQALRDLQRWVDFHFCSKANGVPLWPSLPSKANFTDAGSTLEYGCVLADDTTLIPTEARRAFGGYWTADPIPWHITMKELVAVRLGLSMYADELRGHTVRLWEDNQAVVLSATARPDPRCSRQSCACYCRCSTTCPSHWYLATFAASSIQQINSPGSPTETRGDCVLARSASCSTR